MYIHIKNKINICIYAHTQNTHTGEKGDGWGVSLKRVPVGIAVSGKQRCHLLCQTVRPNSPADVAGLRTGDRIVRVNAWDGASVTCKVTLKDALGAPEAKITFQRDNRTMQVMCVHVYVCVNIHMCVCVFMPWARLKQRLPFRGIIGVCR